MPIQRYGVSPDKGAVPIATAVRAGDMVFISGQVAFGADNTVIDGDIKAQTRRTLERLIEVMAEAGCSTEHVVKATAWITKPEHFKPFNEAYAEVFGAAPPARSTVVTQLVVDALVEIELVAYLGA